MNRTTFTIIFFFGIILELSAQQRIERNFENGMFILPCKVNGLELEYIFDTGASDVTISLSEALFMVKNGYLLESDFKGTSFTQIANGEMIENTSIIIREMEISGIIIHDVEASIIDEVGAPLLLGQSALSMLEGYTVEGDVLTLNVESTETRKEDIDRVPKLIKEGDKYYFDSLYKLAKMSYEEAYNINVAGLRLPFTQTKRLAESCMNIKDYISAAKYFEEFEKGIALYDSNQVCLMYNDLSEVYSELGNQDRELLNIGKSIQFACTNTLKGLCYHNLGMFHALNEDFDLAKKAIEHAINIILKDLNISSENVLSGDIDDELLGGEYYVISLIHEVNGDTKECEKHLILAALCGNKDAINECKSRGLNY